MSNESKTRLPATHSGLCRACENKKLREVLSAPRPDVSLGELDEETLLDAAHILLSCGSPGWERVRKKAAHRIGQRMVAAAEAAALRAQSPAEGGFVLVSDLDLEWLDRAAEHFAHIPTTSAENMREAIKRTAIALRESQAEGKGEWIATWNRDHGEPGGTP